MGHKSHDSHMQARGSLEYIRVCVCVFCSHMRVLSALDMKCSQETAQEIPQPPEEGYGGEDLPQVSPVKGRGREGMHGEGWRWETCTCVCMHISNTHLIDEKCSTTPSSARKQLWTATYVDSSIMATCVG